MRTRRSIAITALDRAVDPRPHFQAQRYAAVADALLHHRIQGLVAHDAALAHLPRLQFKLGLDQHDQVALRREQRHQRRQHQSERDERQVARHQVKHGRDLHILSPSSALAHHRQSALGPRAGNVGMCSDKLRALLGSDPFRPWPAAEELLPTDRRWHHDRTDGNGSFQEIVRRLYHYEEEMIRASPWHWTKDSHKVHCPG